MGFDLPKVKPGQTAIVDIPVEVDQDHGNTWLEISFQLKSDTAWATTGHDIAWSQLTLHEDTISPLDLVLKHDELLQVHEANGRLFISSASFQSHLTFDLIRGSLHWSNQRGQIITSGPELGLYRSLTQNDVGFGGDGQHWAEFRLSSARMAVREVKWKFNDDGVFTIISSIRVAPPALEWACNAVMTYSITPDVVQIETKGDFSANYPKFIPRIGLTMSLPNDLIQVEWFGRGPSESYCDKKQAARLGRWKASLDELQTPYEFPQENGNRSDVRWARFRSTETVLEARMGTPFNFSLRKYSTEDLYKSRHPHELTELLERILNLDYRHHSLGSGSCGPAPFAQDRLAAGPFEFITEIRILE